MLRTESGPSQAIGFHLSAAPPLPPPPPPPLPPPRLNRESPHVSSAQARAAVRACCWLFCRVRKQPDSWARAQLSALGDAGWWSQKARRGHRTQRCSQLHCCGSPGLPVRSGSPQRPALSARRAACRSPPESLVTQFHPRLTGICHRDSSWLRLWALTETCYRHHPSTATGWVQPTRFFP